MGAFGNSAANKIECPECGQRIAFEAEHYGVSTECPGCRAPLTIPVAAEMTAPSAPACEQCGSAMSPEAVICTDCGWNHETGRQLATRRARTSSKRGKLTSDRVFNITLAAVSVLYLVLFLRANNSPEHAIQFLLAFLPFSFGVWIWALAWTFRRSIPAGIVGFFISIYLVWYVYTHDSGPRLRWALLVSILFSLGLIFIRPE